jgi:DNA repair protein RadC
MSGRQMQLLDVENEAPRPRPLIQPQREKTNVVREAYAQPFEKLEMWGAEDMSTAELLAVVVGCATEDAERILQEFRGLHGLARMTTRVKAVREACGAVGTDVRGKLEALFMLSQKLNTPEDITAVAITSPADVAGVFQSRLRYLKHEEIWVLLVNTRNKVVAEQKLYQGTLNECVIRTGEVFRKAIELSAASIILVHNHPAGDPEPSMEDVQTTRKISEAGKLLNITLLDHVIIGGGRYVSLRERGRGFVD